MVEKDQNRHLFFQGLYKREEEKKKSKNKKSARTKRIDAFIEARNQVSAYKELTDDDRAAPNDKMVIHRI